jgi:hypothetical protein
MNELEVERRLTSVEKLAGSNRHRIDDMEKRQDNLDSLVSSVAVMAKEQEHIKSDGAEIKADVKALTTKPGKRWDGLVDNLIWGVCGALLTFLLAKILGG